MPKFFVNTDDVNGNTITLSGSGAEHLKVLRVREGEELTVNAGDTDYRCAVEYAGGNTFRLQILSSGSSEGEPDVSAAVYAALPKGDKTETIIQKAVELGAAKVCLFLSSRCVARPDAKALKGKLERWNKIAEAAAMQSYRGRIPEVTWLPDFDSMLREAGQAELRAFLWEDAHEVSLRGLIRQAGAFRTAALVTGPEGGFSKEEAQRAEMSGVMPVTLGKRILRCETAPLVALGAVMLETGNME